MRRLSVVETKAHGGLAIDQAIHRGEQGIERRELFCGSVFCGSDLDL
jgi:hypothetical protein